MDKNILNIKSNYNFLESLVHFILENHRDPLHLSKTTILLPSRRLCREIKKILLKRSNSQALILPRIIAIGDIDYDEFGPNFITEKNPVDYKDLPLPPLSSLKYKLLLISEIKKWNQTTHLFGKNINSASLANIAANLQSFLEEVEKEKINLDHLQEVDDFNLAGHKQQIIRFLRHFGSNWQNILMKNKTNSIASYRNQMIDFSAGYLKNYGSEYPIIAAGSTGSVAATANLLKVISEQANGYVILYGLDKNLTRHDWEEIGPEHPQYMLKRLTGILKIKSEEIKDLEFPQFKNAHNDLTYLIYNTLLPAEKTSRWPKIKAVDPQAISHISLIKAANNFEEAQIISLAIRKNLEDKNKIMALITNDRRMALMVKANLRKWQINVDDSKYNNLSNSEIGFYIKSIADLFSEGFKATKLLGILKHRTTKAGFAEEFYKKNLQILELEILRNFKGKKDLEYLKDKITSCGNQELIIWFNHLYSIFEPLTTAFLKAENNFDYLFAKNLQCAEELSKNSEQKITLYNLPAAEEFMDFSQKLLNEAQNYNIDSASYCKLLDHFLCGYNFSLQEDFHPRVHILSTIEARLINYDLMIICGLNEGEFLQNSANNDWLSRKMRLDIGLMDPERKTGITAYDFSNYLANKEVIITRSLNSNNSPALKVRFLMKLEALIKIAGFGDKLNDGAYYKNLLHNLTSHQKLIHIQRPAPKPELQYRPKIISVTDVKRWLNDPYFIYAKRILNLKALNKTEEEPSFAEFGNFIHKTLEIFINNYSKIEPQDRMDKLLHQYGKMIFQEYFTSEENKLLWWPRFENIARWFVENEQEIQKQIKNSSTEVNGSMVINQTTLTTKIDRIDINLNDEITILDYKTGATPGDSDVKKGLEPQLALEAVILCFGELPDKLRFLHSPDISQIKKLQYYKLKGQENNEIKDLKDTEKLIFEAKNGIARLTAIFNDPKTSYISCPNHDLYQERFNDYHHLARIDEWL